MNTTTSLTHELHNGGSPTTVLTTVAQATDVAASIGGVEDGNEPVKNNVVHSVAGVKLDVVNDSNQIKIKNQVQPTVQLCTEDNKKIIISGAKSVQDIPVNVLQQILNNVKNVKPNETVLVINHNKHSVQSSEVKSYESIVKDVLGVESPKETDDNSERASLNNATKMRNDCSESLTSNEKFKSNAIADQKNSQNDCIISKNLKIKNDETKIKICNVDAIINKRKEEKCDQENLKKDPSPPKTRLVQPSKNDPKQKKFLYRLKSKNGRILSYISETPITLKKPIICLKKMTQEDAERLSKQFSEDSKRKTRQSSKSSKSTVDLTTDTDENSTSQQSYGVQTRKRRLKFLPDGRQVKDKRSRLGSSSSLSSLDDSDDEDLKKPVVSSDEDYIENLDAPAVSSDEDVKIVSVKPPTKKITPQKNPSVEKNRTLSNENDIKNVNQLGNLTPSVAIPPNKTSSTTLASKKTSIEPATVFSSLLKIPILPSQLNVIRFKPKILSTQVNKNNSFMFKKIYTPDVDNRLSLNSLSKTLSIGANTSLSNSITTPRSTNYTTGLNSSTLNKRDSWASKNIQPKVDYRTSSLNPPPLAPLSQKLTPISRNFNHCIVKKTIGNHVQNQTVLDITAKFDGFTNSRIVKTKAGPKKAILEELKKSDETRTIYEIMEEIFDSMPHWNIHVIPENKSFCLAQISLGRTGIPILKKSIEINSEFMAKVYVHQLHCKRYDGIYDTESKIKKLISDVESLAS